MVSTQPSLLHLIFISRHVELEGQPTQEDFLVLEDLVRVGIMSGTPGVWELHWKKPSLREAGAESRTGVNGPTASLKISQIIGFAQKLSTDLVLCALFMSIYVSAWQSVNCMAPCLALSLCSQSQTEHLQWKQRM